MEQPPHDWVIQALSAPQLSREEESEPRVVVRMEQNQQHCIIQALSAPQKEEESEPRCIIQALIAAGYSDEESPTKRDSASRKDKEAPSQRDSGSRKNKEVRNRLDGAMILTPASDSRCTRSQAAPDWTMQEMLVLVGEVAAVDEDWIKSLSSFQKWKIVSDNCVAFDVFRPSNQCKRKWDSLLAEYRKIRNWESKPKAGSYWCLDSNAREKYGLPTLFHLEVFDAMDAVITAQETVPSSGTSDSEDLVDVVEAEMLDAVPSSGTSDSEDLVVVAEAEMLDANSSAGCEEECWSEIKKSPDKAQEMANVLQGSAERIHAILRGELPEDASRGLSLVDLTKPNAIEMEFTRRQADELIKAFGGLVNNLDQFAELIKDGKCEGIRPVSPVSF